MLYLVNDGNCAIEIDAASSSEAAQIYVDDGDWEPCNKTWWCHVTTWQEQDGEVINQESHMVAVDPDEPSCDADYHEWYSPHSLVGGLKENPGVFGHGGGVVVVEICRHCGLTKTTDTWAQCRQTGIQGLTSIEYNSG